MFYARCFLFPSSIFVVVDFFIYIFVCSVFSMRLGMIILFVWIDNFVCLRYTIYHLYGDFKMVFFSVCRSKIINSWKWESSYLSFKDSLDLTILLWDDDLVYIDCYVEFNYVWGSYSLLSTHEREFWHNIKPCDLEIMNSNIENSLL